MKIDIGSGNRPEPGYSSMDALPEVHPEILWDAAITPYPFKDNSVEALRSHWVLEHFAERNLPRILKEWYRILEPNGKIHMTTNNYEAHIKALNEGIITWMEFSRMFFGIKEASEIGDTPVNVFECHKFAWTVDLARKYFEEAGFKNVVVDATWKHREEDGTIKCPGIIIQATK